MDARWHNDFTNWDYMRRHATEIIRAYAAKSGEEIAVPESEDERIKLVYRIMMIIYTENGDMRIHGDSISGTSVGAVHCVHDYLWNRLGCPRWFIDREMAAILAKTEIDEDLSGIRWPHDAFHIVFERGMTVGEIPLRAMSISYPHSKLAEDICDRDLRVKFDAFHRTDAVPMHELIAFRCDCGENGETGIISEDTPIDSVKTWDWKRRLDNPNVMHAVLSENEFAAVHEACKIAVAAVLYWSARPEFVADYSVPRSSRYQYKHREHCKRVYLPVEKVIRPSGVSDPLIDHGSKSPHFRGFVLRTLRHERYARNDDGTLKVILVPPCAIHPELMEGAKA